MLTVSQMRCPLLIADTVGLETTAVLITRMWPSLAQIVRNFCLYTFLIATPKINNTFDVVILRLVTKNERTSPSLTAGRVEIFHDRRWGTICSKGFSLNDAQVLCQALTGSSSVLKYGINENAGEDAK